MTEKNVQTRYMLIDKTYSKSGKVVDHSQERESIEVRVPPEGVPLGSVTYSNGVKLELKQYENVSALVSVTLPTTVEELPEAYATAHTFVNDRLDEEIESIQKLKKTYCK